MDTQENELLDMMGEALDNIYEYYESTNINDVHFSKMIDDIDNKVYFVSYYYKYGWCLWLPTRIKSSINNICNIILSYSNQIVKHTNICHPISIDDVENDLPFNDSSDDK